MRHLVTILLLLAPAVAQAQCKVTFAVVRQIQPDELVNGFQSKTLEWFQKKVAKKYPDVCYTADPASTNVVLFFSETPAVYHGFRTVVTSDTSRSPVSGTVTDRASGQEVGDISGTVNVTTTTTQRIPYEVDYERLFVAIEYRFSSGWKPLESFDGETLHPSYYGICTRNCRPRNSMIEEAIKYLHKTRPRSQ